MTNTLSGYVYILEVADIDLPVCKIGMTTRDPVARCQEINKSSTGDFIWSVAYSFAVNDCQKFESLIHHKLTPLRQKRREFFNLGADDACKAIVSILESQQDIKTITLADVAPSAIQNPEMKTKKTKRPQHTFTTRHDAAEYSALLQSFCTILGIKGRPFGQLNKPFFGMSDGHEGVQWNISLRPQDNIARIGVNLEGLMYRNWPISRLIQSELSTPRLLDVIQELDPANEVSMTFARDAWQVASRPEIKEKYIGGKSFTLSELTAGQWQDVLNEALECLDKAHHYQKRSQQAVTVIKKDGDHQLRTMQVSPHLTIWSSFTLSSADEQTLRARINQLDAIYRWMNQVS
ncbi:GIY-YIG nuclease family protein [Enterobacter sp. JUb54]|uniref:GIY-YIG nuclease family protein n=1 Tax=Enterobacter sp. JUb54 TaxID=2724468 RepID=UPI00164DF7BE|nr:GIY-YIG nuclease family protein [Enterobacter sp. JUb54]QNK09463.1 GIY-YIG nuclease family protein [Enterobacter sp. JUb54]